MSPDLRSKAINKFLENNWVTGLSSPWVDSYQVIELQSNSTEAIYKVIFKMMTSEGKAGEDIVTIQLRYNNDKWYITQISSSNKKFYFNID